MWDPNCEMGRRAPYFRQSRFDLGQTILISTESPDCRVLRLPLFVIHVRQLPCFLRVVDVCLQFQQLFVDVVGDWSEPQILCHMLVVWIVVDCR